MTEAQQTLDALYEIVNSHTKYEHAKLQRVNFEQRRTLEAKSTQLQERRQELERQQEILERALAAADASLREQVTLIASRYLPDGWRLSLDASGAFVLSAAVDGERRPGTSGSQGVEIICSLLSALPSVDPGRALVLCLPDVDWDPEHQADFMRRIKDAPHQVLLTSTSKPKGRTPAGWTIIDLSDAESYVEGFDQPVKPTLRVVKGGSSPKVPVLPAVPADGPEWLAAQKPIGAQPMASLSALAAELERAAPTATEIHRAPKHTVDDGVFHLLEGLGVITYSPLDSTAQRWYWRVS